MNFNLFLIILIALLIIFCIILYNGIRILLTVGKEKGTVKYEFKVTVLKIPIFKRTGSEGIIDIIRRKNQEEDSEKTKEDSESKDEISKTQKESSEPKDKSTKAQKESAKSKDETRDKKITDSEEKIAESEEGKDEKEIDEEEEEEKSLREKYKEIKPILKELKKSKKELKTFLKNILKAINLKKLEGHLIIGLSDHATTIKIASWIWSIGAIVNSKKPTLLTVEPRFTEIIVDFEGRIELKINLFLLIIYSLLLLTKKNIRELIKVLYREYKSQSKEEEEPVENESTKKEEETNEIKEEKTSEDEDNPIENEIEKATENEENTLEKETEGKIEEDPSENKGNTLEKGIEGKIEEETKDEKEEAVTQVKQLMKIIKSD